MSSVQKEKRFSQAAPCPICGGHAAIPQGRQQRCYGFISSDARWAHCTREQLSGKLAQHDGSGTYPHQLRGRCGCGVTHGHLRPADTGILPQTQAYEIRGADGSLVAVHLRTEGSEGKRMWWRLPDGATGLDGRPANSLPLYGTELLVRTNPGTIVVVVEGEKAADALRQAGVTVLATVTGANGCPDNTALQALSGFDVFLWPDNDQVGRTHMVRVATALARLAVETKMVEWPDAPEKGDAADWLARGGTTLSLGELLERATRFEPAVAGSSTIAETDSTLSTAAMLSAQRLSPAARLANLARSSLAELFRTPTGEPFATAKAAGQGRSFSLEGKTAEDWLRRIAVELEHSTPSGQAVADALLMLRSEAHFGGNVRAVHLRIAGANGAVYLDLGRDDWSVVEVDANGWRLINAVDAPVRFRRTRATQPLPMPVTGGRLDELRPFVNCACDDDFRLLLSVTANMFFPTGPYPILALGGEQGCAKSTTSRVLRELVDPKLGALGAVPASQRDLMVSAHNNWALSYDNLSGIQTWLSDALCRLSTGGGYAVRQNYSDSEEMVFDAQRPIIINGIDAVGERGDLADRIVSLTLPRIPREQRRPESEFWQAFEAAKPRIIGAFLDGVSLILGTEEHFSTAGLPRMADFARRSYALASLLGWAPDEFLACYEGNGMEMRTQEVENSEVSLAVIRMLDRREAWAGSAGELFQALLRIYSQRPPRRFPNSPQGLANHLRRAAPSLRAVGIDVEFARTGEKRIIAISKLEGVPAA